MVLRERLKGALEKDNLGDDDELVEDIDLLTVAQLRD